MKRRNGLFAAVGAATGLGNAFRFPTLCARYGAAFIIAYAVALVAVCYPLLCAELRVERALKGERARKVWRVIMRAATVNSALIALYYGVIASKLGCACVFEGDCPTSVFALAAVAIWGCVLLVLSRRALPVTGALSTVLSAAMFAAFAVAGIVRGGLPSLSLAVLAKGGVWVDALGQALLSLSLAAGVMPVFARTLTGPAAVSALKIVAANFIGCLCAAFATVPFAPVSPQTVGVNTGILLFNGVICALFPPVLVPVARAVVFGVLTLVAVHSLSSLANPLVGEGKKRPAAFCAAGLALTPLFSACGGAVLAACDMAACSQSAVVIALCECLFFASLRDIRGAIAVIYRIFCPITCGVVAVFSLCSARITHFPPLAAACAYVCVAAVLCAAAAKTAAKAVKKLIPRLTNIANCDKIP